MSEQLEHDFTYFLYRPPSRTQDQLDEMNQDDLERKRQELEANLSQALEEISSEEEEEVFQDQQQEQSVSNAVSYTHLTLPTIYSV